MSVRVAIVKCKDYDERNVKQSLKKAIELLGGLETIVGKKKRILIKPNLCLSEPPEKHLTTHPEIIKQLSLLCQGLNSDIVIGDNPVGKASLVRLNDIWNRTGMEYYLKGIEHQRTLLKNNFRKFSVGIGDDRYDYYIAEDVFSVDAIINAAKFKTHGLMLITNAVKNLYGLLPGNSKKKLHALLPEVENFASLLVDIYDRIKPKLNIVDAVYSIEGDGPGFKGQKRYMGLILASTDAVAIDVVVEKMINLKEYTIPTNRAAKKKGIGEWNLHNIEIVGESIEDCRIEDFKLPNICVYHKGITKKLFNLARAYLSIDVTLCKKCGLCRENCPVDAIGIAKDEYKINQETCIACMTCQELCPTGAVCSYRPDFYKQLINLGNKKNSSNVES